MATLPTELIRLALTHAYPRPSVTDVDVQLERDRTALMRSACLVGRTWLGPARLLLAQHVLLTTPAQADVFDGVVWRGLASVVRTVTVDAAVDECLVDAYAYDMELGRRLLRSDSSIASDDTAMERRRSYIRSRAMFALTGAAAEAVSRCPCVEVVRASRASALTAGRPVWRARAIVVDQLGGSDVAGDDYRALEAFIDVAHVFERSPLVRSLTVLRSWPSWHACRHTLTAEAAGRLTHLHLGASGDPVSFFDRFVFDNDAFPALVSLVVHVAVIVGSSHIAPGSGESPTAVALFGAPREPRMPALRTLVMSVAARTEGEDAFELLAAVPLSVTAFDARFAGSLPEGGYHSLFCDYTRRGTLEVTVVSEAWSWRWRASVDNH